MYPISIDVDIDVFSHIDTTNDAFSNKGDIENTSQITFKQKSGVESICVQCQTKLTYLAGLIFDTGATLWTGIGYVNIVNIQVIEWSIESCVVLPTWSCLLDYNHTIFVTEPNITHHSKMQGDYRLVAQIPRCASPCRTIHHFGYIYATKWCIVGICLMHYGICEMGLLYALYSGSLLH